MFAIRFAVCARVFLRSLSAQRRLHEQAMGPQGGKARKNLLRSGPCGLVAPLFRNGFLGFLGG